MSLIATAITQMMEQGLPDLVARNQLAQFGDPQRRYIGAELLPERNVDRNAFREEQIRWRTVIAADSTRYSPAQKRGSDLYSTFLVELGDSDIMAEMTAQDYELLLRMLQHTGQPINGLSMQAITQVTNWLDIRVNRALIESCEKQRWEYLVDGMVVRVGDNGYSEVVKYANPPGHRLTPAKQWTDPTSDPYDDIQAACQVLINKGYTPGRIFTSSRVVGIMSRNPAVKQRGGTAVVVNNTTAATAGNPPSGTVRLSRNNATASSINQMLRDDGLPVLETYDLQYRTQFGTKRFMPDNCVVIVAGTERNQDASWLSSGGYGPDMWNLFLKDQQQRFGSIIGYHAIGLPTGHQTPGRVMLMKSRDEKPPSVTAQGWQSHLPVPLDVEGVVVIKNLFTSP